MAKKRNRKPLRVRVFHDESGIFDERMTPREAHLVRRFASAIGAPTGISQYDVERGYYTLKHPSSNRHILVERPDV